VNNTIIHLDNGDFVVDPVLIKARNEAMKNLNSRSKASPHAESQLPCNETALRKGVLRSCPSSKDEK